MRRKSRKLITKEFIEIINKNINDGKTLKEVSRMINLSYVTLKKVRKLLSEDENYLKINMKKEREIKMI